MMSPFCVLLNRKIAKCCAILGGDSFHGHRGRRLFCDAGPSFGPPPRFDESQAIREIDYRFLFRNRFSIQHILPSLEDFFENLEQCNNSYSPTKQCHVSNNASPTMMTTWSQSDTTVGFSAWPPSPPLTLHAQPPPFDPRHHNDYQAAIHVSHDVRWNSPRCVESPNCGLIVVAEQQQQKQNSSLRIANSRIMRRRNNVVDMQNSYFEQDLQFCEANYETYQNDNSMPTTTNHLTNLDSSSCDSDELFSLDSMINCDITSLDAFVHDNESSSFTTQSTSNIINSPDMTTSPSTVEDEDPVDEFFPQLTHRNKITIKESSDYRLKRDKNNISSQKSRAKRQAIVMAQKEEKEKLEIQQIKLKAMVKSLEEQVEDYKRMVMMFVHSK